MLSLNSYTLSWRDKADILSQERRYDAECGELSTFYVDPAILRQKAIVVRRSVH